MAGRKVSAIKIKDLRYSDVLKAAPTIATIPALFKAAKKIDNSHQGTFAYEEDDPTINSYKNELNGKIYRSDTEPGDKRINFTIGQYDFETKAAMQGGKTSDDGKSWTPGDATEQRYKAMFVITEDNVLIVFPQAMIVGRSSTVDSAIGIAVSAIPQEISGSIGNEYWFDSQGLDLEDDSTPVG